MFGVVLCMVCMVSSLSKFSVVLKLSRMRYFLISSVSACSSLIMSTCCGGGAVMFYFFVVIDYCVWIGYVRCGGECFFFLGL